MRTARGEIATEAVPTDVLHALLIWYGWHGHGREVTRQLLVEEDEVGEAASDSGVLALELGERALYSVSIPRNIARNP